ncbi:MAG: hypothetical protein M1814_003567 [Vezdaea aestivalis]|nr:MAG: hypothetical protein M1814_003567 [Vezdaea aestivalis]
MEPLTLALLLLLPLLSTAKRAHVPLKNRPRAVSIVCNKDNLLRCLSNAAVATPYCSSWLTIETVTATTITVYPTASITHATTATTTKITPSPVVPSACFKPSPSPFTDKVDSACLCLSLPTPTVNYTTTMPFVSIPTSAPSGAVYLSAPGSPYDATYLQAPSGPDALLLAGADSSNYTAFTLSANQLTPANGTRVAIQSCNDISECGVVSADPKDGAWAVYFEDGGARADMFYNTTWKAGGKADGGKGFLEVSQGRREEVSKVQVCDFYGAYRFVEVAVGLLSGCVEATLALV